MARTQKAYGLQFRFQNEMFFAIIHLTHEFPMHFNGLTWQSSVMFTDCISALPVRKWKLLCYWLCVYLKYLSVLISCEMNTEY